MFSSYTIEIKHLIDSSVKLISGYSWIHHFHKVCLTDDISLPPSKWSLWSPWLCCHHRDQDLKRSNHEHEIFWWERGRQSWTCLDYCSDLITRGWGKSDHKGLQLPNLTASLLRPSLASNKKDFGICICIRICTYLYLFIDICVFVYDCAFFHCLMTWGAVWGHKCWH